MSFPSLPLGLHLSFTFLLLSSPFLWSTKQTWLQRKKRGICLSFHHIRFFCRFGVFSESYFGNYCGIIIPWSKKFRATWRFLWTLHTFLLKTETRWPVFSCNTALFLKRVGHPFDSEIKIHVFLKTLKNKHAAKIELLTYDMFPNPTKDVLVLSGASRQCEANTLFSCKGDQKWPIAA